MENKKNKGRLYYVFALSTYISSYWKKFAASISVHAIFKILPVGISILSSYMIGAAITGKLVEMRKFFYIIIALILLEGLFYFFDIYISHDIAYRILSELRNIAYSSVDRVAPAAMEGKESGDIISIAMDDITILEWFYAHTIGQWIVALIIPLIALLVIGSFSYKIALSLIPFVFILFFIPVFTAKESDIQGKNLREKMGKLNAQMIDGIQGLMDIISFQAQKIFFSKFIRINDEYQAESVRYAARSAKESAYIILTIGCAILVFQGVSIYTILNGELKIIWLLPLYSLTALVFNPILETMMLSRNYGMIFASTKRVFELFQSKAFVEDTGYLESLDLKEEICVKLDQVSFSYPSKEIQNPLILDGISFEFKQGETVALVGSSGSGKTTITRLLQRFYDPKEGIIQINGTDIRNIKLNALREMITVVPQEMYLFNRSIGENLRMAHPEASEREMIEAVEKAQILDVIERMPQSWDTHVGEKGLKLSGGEKARLALAQAFLKDAPILILDEASANLDSENEKKINEAVNQLKEGRATLIIAHRISTMQSADRIILLKDGKVERQGNFFELINSCEYFQKLIGTDI